MALENSPQGCGCAGLGPPGSALRAFAGELLDTLGRVGPADTERVISEIGLRAGEFLETSYRLRSEPEKDFSFALIPIPQH